MTSEKYCNQTHFNEVVAILD